jgi:ADP-heptose:LPS heptosyltransferase
LFPVNAPPHFGKRVEWWARGLSHRALATLLPGPTANTTAVTPDWNAHPTRVLVVRYDAMGDTVLLTSLIRAIARSHPSITVDALVLAPNADVLAGLPEVNEILPFDRTNVKRNPPPDLLARIRSNRYDVFVDAVVLRNEIPTATLMMMIASRARYRVGLHGKRNAFLYNLPVRGDTSGHHVDLCAALATPFGVDPSTADMRPTLAVSDPERTTAERRWHAATTSTTDRPTRLLVNVSAAHPTREWRDERFAEVIRHTREHHPLTTLVTGRPNDSVRIASIAAAAGVQWTVQPLRDAIALVASSDLVLTPDTGTTHIASALNRPTVSLHQRNKWMWTPYHVPNRVLFATDDTTLDTIPAAKVAAALDELLNEVMG